MANHYHFNTHYSLTHPTHPLNQVNPASPYYHLYHTKKDVLVQPHQSLYFDRHDALIIGGGILTGVLLVWLLMFTVNRRMQKSLEKAQKELNERCKDMPIKPEIEQE